MDININIPDIQVDYLAETWGKDMEDTSQTNEQFVTEYVHVLHTQEVISKGRQELMQSILNGNQVAAVKINDGTYDSLILSGQLEDAYQLLRNDVRAYLDYLDSLVV